PRQAEEPLVAGGHGLRGLPCGAGRRGTGRPQGAALEGDQGKQVGSDLSGGGAVEASAAMTERCRNCGKPSDGSAFPHDWQAMCPHCGQLLWLRPGDVAECRVARLTPFGVIVELGDGVEGLVHITELAAPTIRHHGEVVSVGSMVRAMVLRVDVPERSIGLSRRRLVSRSVPPATAPETKNTTEHRNVSRPAFATFSGLLFRG